MRDRRCFSGGPAPGRPLRPALRFGNPPVSRSFGAAVCAFAISSCALAQVNDAAESSSQTVVITGSSADPVRKAIAAEQAATPGAVTIVDGESLRQRSVTSLADMLRYVPGLFVASGSAGDSSFFSARGSNLDATN